MYVIDKSNYERSVLEAPPTGKESSHMRLNDTSMDSAATFLGKRSKLNQLIVEMLKTEDFKDNFR